jgi:hypothetical protein
MLFARFQTPDGEKFYVNLAKVIDLHEDKEGRCYLNMIDGEILVTGTIEDNLLNIKHADVYHN